MSGTYLDTRLRLETYFDRTAFDAWKRLTSDAPVSRIRETVRAGRDAMRALLLSWLPDDLSGRTLLDAGCGTGALAVAASRRGARVVAIDLSPTLVRLAAERAGDHAVAFRAGDMLDPALGTFDHIVAMDSLIHYAPDDAVRALASLAARARVSVLTTFAPRTPLLTLMHASGKLFPRADRAPAIVPVSPRGLGRRLDRAGLRRGRSERITSGFYLSQALELPR